MFGCSFGNLSSHLSSFSHSLVMSVKKDTVGARIPNPFGFRMVRVCLVFKLCSVFEWSAIMFYFCMVRTMQFKMMPSLDHFIKSAILLLLGMSPQKCFSKFFHFISKKFAHLGARAVLVGPILPVFASKLSFLD